MTSKINRVLADVEVHVGLRAQSHQCSGS